MAEKKKTTKTTAKKTAEKLVDTQEVPIVQEAEIKEDKKDNDVITAKVTSKNPTEKKVLGSTESGAIGTTPAKKVASRSAEKKKITETNAKKKAEKEETVAIYSSRNVTWSDVGKVYRGYNIVSKEAADKWLTRNHTRLATPEEVAEEFGK